nr:protein kinase-like domain, concanavalin A-like lectin/glucanase domain protein [Tanacetum cinerariifolium]
MGNSCLWMMTGKLLYKDDSMVHVDSEVEEVFNETVGKKVDDDYDPYDDDLYDGYDMSDNLQVVCDDLDIKVLGDIEDKVDNSSPQSSPQVILSFKVYTPPVNYPKEVEETIGISMEVEPLDHTKLEDLALNSCSHDLFPSSREFPSGDEPELQPLPNLPLLDVNLGGKRGTNPPINPYSSGTFRMKEITNGNLRVGFFDEKKKFFFTDLETASGLLLTVSPGNSMAPKSIAVISHYEREELRKKGFKIPSKLFSPKYFSTTSIKELNMNPSAPKRVHFVNLIVILSKDSHTKKDISSTNACRRNLDKITRGNVEVKEQGKEEDEMETNIKVKEKPSNPNKISNFIGRVRNLIVFIGSFTYEYDFMILEDTTSIIDRCLGEIVFGRPFIDETGLVYNIEEGTVMFKQDNEKIKVKMLHTMEIFKQIRLMGASIDSTPSLTYEENFSNGRTLYYQSLLIGDEYKQDE